MRAAPRLLLRAGYRSMPWRNGAGTTLEIARAPASGDDFDWRLSLATVAASGPFSAYAGYERLVALASGPGFTLSVGAQPPATLAAAGESLVFPGAAATRCELIAGECLDLSLIVRQPGRVLGVERIAVDAGAVALPLAAPLAAVFCLTGGAACAPAGRAPSAALALAAGDTLLVPDGTGDWSANPAEFAPALLLVLRWQAAGETTKIGA